MRVCDGCGLGAIDTRARYCSACGARLAFGSADDLADAPTVSDQQWLTEVRYLTVLYADLVKSTEIVALLDAEDAMHRLRPILDVMCRVVEEAGGVVLSTAGDGIVGLFGAFRTEERHAELGCYAALKLRDAIRMRDRELSVRAGLHSGEVVVHHGAADPAGTITAYGVTLHLASRLSGVVSPNEICITDACRALTRQAFRFRPFGSHALRGVPKPVRLHLLEDEAVGAEPALAGSGQIPFLNRVPEMAILSAALGQARESRAETICLFGTPGTGKTRLCQEFARLCHEVDVPVFRTGIQPHGAMSPMRSLGLLLRDSCFSPVGGTVSVETVASVLAGIGANSGSDLALFCGLLGLPAPGKVDLLTPQARIARLVELLARLIHARSDGPRVLLVEDVHWIDEPGRTLLTGLSQAVAGSQTMLVLNSRPTEVMSWLSLLGRSVELGELSPSDSDRLVRFLLGTTEALDVVRASVVARSAGNPFFAEELVRSLIEDGSVVASGAGQFDRGELREAPTLPPTVQAVIRSRIDRLPRPARELLQLAAVVGKEFPVALLRLVWDFDTETIDATLAGLQANGLVRPIHRVDTGLYEFWHPLIQEVAYGTQLKERRSQLHAEVARALQELYPEPDGDMAGVIAVHLEEAGQYAEAAAFAAQAARWQGQHSARAAIERWHKVRALLGRAPAGGEAGGLGIEANGQVAWLGWREGHTAEQAEPYLQAALADAMMTGHPMTSLLMLVRGRMAQVSGGDADAFVRTLLEALAMSQAQGDRGRVATLQASLSHAYGWAGLLKEALSANDAALADAHLVADTDQQFLGYDVRDWALSLRGRILLRLGMVAPARGCFDLMIERKGSTDPTVSFVGHFGYVELAQAQENEALATEHAAQLDALARRHSNAYLTFYAAVAMALANAVAGRLDEALNDVRGCLALQRRTGAAMEFEPELLASLAELQRRSGALEAATETAGAAERLSVLRNARLPLLRAVITRAEAALLMPPEPSRRQQAAADLARAETLMEATGARLYQPLLARAQARLGPAGRTSSVNSGNP